ncbi:MAG: 30S ribosomal protein S20 [Bdellovibrionia bacterium]
MANHKSAEKRARQSNKIRDRNSKAKSTVRTWEKKLRAAVATKDTKVAQELLREFTSRIDKAAQKGIVHVKSASRKVARISSQISALVAKK